jgi:hypothetical protein
MFDRDDHLATTKTDAEGAFNLDGESAEQDGSIEPYLIIKACRNESSCNIKKFTAPAHVAVMKNYNHFMDEEFCQHCQSDAVCQSA